MPPTLTFLASITPAPNLDEVLRGLQGSLDTVWILTATALVFFMQLGVALLEGGAVRAKNTINVIMKNYTDMCFGGLAFALVGFGLMFGSNGTGWFGTDRFLLQNVTPEQMAFVLFQMMFAATAATIVSGALAERIRYRPYVVFSVLMTTFVYSIFGSWAWGSFFDGTTGWLRGLGFIDFAGATVVHAVGGWCALAGIVVLGPRLGRFSRTGEARLIPGHNLPLVAAGGLILWLGWFGFNGGSVLRADAALGSVLINTHLAGTAGVTSALILLALTKRPILLTHTVNGGLAGLVAITANAPGSSPLGAIAVGLVAGVLVILGMGAMERFRLDDPVGAVPVHALCGTWGTLAAGLFRDGQFAPEQLLVQALGAGVALIWGFGAGWVLFKCIDSLMGLRVSSVEEQRGLDYAEHSEIGYAEFQQDQMHAGRG